MIKFKRKERQIELINLPKTFPQIPGIPKDRVVQGVVFKFGSYHLEIKSDNEDLLRQVVRALDDTKLEWTEEIKLKAGEE